MYKDDARNHRSYMEGEGIMLSIIQRNVNVEIEVEDDKIFYLDFDFNDLYKYKDIIKFVNTFLRCNNKVSHASIYIELDKERWDKEDEKGN